MKTFRHELKYFMNQGEAENLDRRLSLTMDRDSHATVNGSYHIRSLYFDDLENTAVREKMNGVDERKKYRIRIYKLSDAEIFFECKEKVGPYIAKTSLEIDRTLCDELCNGEYGRLLYIDHPLAHELFYQMCCRRLRPTVVVDYVRTPYVAAHQNVRITFDRDIRTGVFSKDLFDKSLPTVSALSSYDLILEVKFDKYLPAYYQSLIQAETFTRSAASKYVICRKFE